MHSLNKQYLITYIKSEREIFYLLINNHIKVLAIIYGGNLLCKALLINCHIVALIIDKTLHL